MRSASALYTSILLLAIPAWLIFGPPPSDPASAATDSAVTGSAVNPAALVGTWTVDLRPTPDAEAYTQPFRVTAVHDDGTFDALFYGSPVQVARYNADWDVLHLAFVTRDNSTRYLHAARLVDGRLHGTTHAVERGFLSVWTAEQ